MLTRAFCMKARRDVPTEKKATLDEAWPDGESMDVPFMRHRERLLAGIAWSIGAEAVICEIRYAGGRLAIDLPPVMAPFSIIRVALPRDRPCPLGEA
ncbi:MAG: hypothetical protein FJ284_12805 [Planctomycetes bacterium]|nr:hypothetical protein [Planctomycetota bacterium]